MYGVLTTGNWQLLPAKLMPFHIHARPAESNALHAQAESLFRATFSAQLDRAARAHHSVPGQSWDLLQNSHHLAGGAGPARGPG